MGVVGSVLMLMSTLFASTGCHAQTMTCLEVYAMHWFYLYLGTGILIGGVSLLIVGITKALYGMIDMGKGSMFEVNQSIPHNGTESASDTFYSLAYGNVRRLAV
jgi:hypothetical protein